MTDILRRERRLPTELSIRDAAVVYTKRLGIVVMIAVVNLLILGLLVFVTSVAWYISVSVLVGSAILTTIVIIYTRHKNRLTEYRVYWKLIEQARRMQFIINRSRFGIQLSARESRSRLIKTIFLLIRSSKRLILGALVAIILIQLSQYLQANLTDGFVYSLVVNIDQGNTESYDAILTAILTFIGIFIPLYLTNLTSAIEEKYSELPAKIRTLIFQERIENIAIQFLFFLVAFILVVLISGAVMGIRPVIMILVSGLLGGLSIPMLFVHFTEQSSFFLDPTLFSGQLFRELLDWAQRATVKGHAWSDRSFQIHYHRQAVSIIESLQSLSDIALRQNQRREGLVTLIAKTVSGFLPRYLLTTKRQIPQDSRWFEQVIKFKDWYLADAIQSSSVMIASATQTSLPPDFKPDHEWIEKRLLAIAETTIARLSEENDFDTIYELLASAPLAYESLGKAWQIGTAQKSLQKMVHSIHMKANISPIPSSSDERHEILARLQAVSNLNTLAINVLLGFFSTAQTINIDALSDSIKQVDWSRNDNIYELNLPACAFSGLEYLVPRLQFELAVEGKVITSDWYVLQITLQSIAQELHKQLIQLLDFGSDFYSSNAKAALENGHASTAMITLGSGMEFFNKFDKSLEETRELVQNIEKRRVLKDIPWPEWDWDEIAQKLRQTEDSLVIQMADCIPALTKDAFALADETPDLLGQALSTVGERCFAAFYENQSQLPREAYAKYFTGIIKKHEMLADVVKNWRNIHTALVFGAEPFTELLELSGYAFLFAEYHRSPELWQSVQSLWDNYLQSDDNKLRIVVLIYQASLARREIGITTRQMMRDRWQQAFGHLLNSIPLVPLSAPSPEYFMLDMVRDHPSLLIRAIAGSDSMSNFFGIGNDAASVFVDLYLNQHINLKKINGYHFEDIRDRLQRQEKRENAHNFKPSNDDGPDDNSEDVN